MEHKKMRVKNATTTMPQTKRVGQRNVQIEIHTLLIMTERIVYRIAV